MQERLREELKEEFPNSDPTWEQLTNGAGLHYLDAVVHEVLLHRVPREQLLEHEAAAVPARGAIALVLAQLLLERFDADGLTRRVGDDRVLRRKARA